MTQSIRYVCILLFRLDGHIILVSFAVVIVMSDGSVESFLFPLDDVLKLSFGVPGSIGNESIFVLICPCSLVHDISAREAEVR